MTRRAIGLGICVPLMLLLSWFLGYPVIGIVGIGFLLVLIAGALFIARPPTTRIKRSVNPSRVTRGEAASVVLRRQNRSPLPAAPLDIVDVIGHLTVEVTIPYANPGKASEANYRFITSRRGHLPVGPAIVSRRDPWGLFVRSRQIGEVGEISVYPRVLKVPAPDILSRLGRDAGAADIAAGSERFHTLREYVVGDELRKIHWPSSARTGTLMIKQMVDSPRPRVLLFCDCNPDVFSDPDRFEQAVDLTVSLAHAIAATGVPLTVCAGQSMAPIEIARTDDLSKMLDAFVTVTTESRPVSAAWLRSTVLRTRASALVAVTGPGNAFLSTLAGLRSVIGESAIYRIGTTGAPQRQARRGLTLVDVATADDVLTLGAPAPVSVGQVR